MAQLSTTASSRHLHTLLPGPQGGHACLTLYDECPHTISSSPSRPDEPYLHCTLPLPDQRAAPHRDETDTTIHRTTLTTLSRTHHPKEKTIAASLAPLVLSRHSPVLRHVRESTAAAPAPARRALHAARSLIQTAPQHLPTIYLLTFSTDRTPTTKAFAALLNTHLPSRCPLLYTIDATRFRVPPAAMCERYSGVADALQEAVLQDAQARREVARAVDDVVGFVCADRGAGGQVGVAVCCTAGTHRSVAVAELVARGVRGEVRRGEGEGVKIVVRHVHRVMGALDPY